ncbi:MAG: hypothetical protein HFF11_06230 [Angelakisella sp.]|nr:hypothetical protein [Angelakisella sp.]
MTESQNQSPAPEPREAIPFPPAENAEAAPPPVPAEAPAETPAEPAAPPPRSTPEKAAASRPKAKGAPGKKKRRRRPSPIPVSMWLLPRYRLPFSTPQEFLRWFLTGINLWAVAAVLLCAFGGYRLVEILNQPRLPGVEQALTGGQATAGLSYTVARTGEKEATVTGVWDPETGGEPPGPDLAAALCAALSPEEIYGHSDHLYQTIARRFFQGEDFDLTIVLREKEPEKPEEGWEAPKPVFSLTRQAGAEDWPRPECTPAFEEAWREAYSGYWIFGQGRKEEMGPPQSDPIFEVGDQPPEEPSSDREEEEAPPLPDLGGEEPDQAEPSPGEENSAGPREEQEPQTEDPPEPPSHGGSSSDPEAPEEPAWGLDRFFQWVLEQAKKYRTEKWQES